MHCTKFNDLLNYVDILLGQQWYLRCSYPFSLLYVTLSQRVLLLLHLALFPLRYVDLTFRVATLSKNADSKFRGRANRNIMDRL